MKASLGASAVTGSKVDWWPALVARVIETSGGRIQRLSEDGPTT